MGSFHVKLFRKQLLYQLDCLFDTFWLSGNVQDSILLGSHTILVYIHVGATLFFELLQTRSLVSNDPSNHNGRQVHAVICIASGCFFQFLGRVKELALILSTLDKLTTRSMNTRMLVIDRRDRGLASWTSFWQQPTLLVKSSRLWRHCRLFRIWKHGVGDDGTGLPPWTMVLCSPIEAMAIPSCRQSWQEDSKRIARVFQC